MLVCGGWLHAKQEERQALGDRELTARQMMGSICIHGGTQAEGFVSQVTMFAIGLRSDAEGAAAS